MSWDEALFKVLYRAAGGAFRRSAAAARACRLEDHRTRLQLLACALASERLVVRASEGDGGWRGDSILVPATLSFAPTPAANLSAYLLRIAYTCTSRRLGFILEDAAGDAVGQALLTWLAVPATRAAMLDALPGAARAETAARAAALAARGHPPVGAAAAALESFARLRLGADADALAALVPAPALAWAETAHSQAPTNPAALRAVVPALLDALPARGRRAAKPPPAVPLWGWLLPPDSAAAASAALGVQDTAALSRGSERRSVARDAAEVVEQPELPGDENPLLHSLESIHTLEPYTGGRKRIDATDEMAQHGDALDELDLRRVVRSPQAAASVYRADLACSDVAGDMADAASPDGVPYDEWDAARRAYRRAWCRIRVTVPAPASGAHEIVRTVRTRQRRHIDDLRALFAHLEAGRRWRLRQPDGPDIDVDAVIDRYARLRAGECSSDRLYATRRRHSRDVALLLLLDCSLSTDGWTANRRVIDVEKESVIVLGEALAGLFDEVAIAAFYSQTRHNCHFLTLKRFREPWTIGYGRLCSLAPCGYTRVGPALRHATELLLRTHARKRLLLLISDGKPTDLDRYEGRHGIADVRQAVCEAEALAVETVALAVDHQARLYLPRMFGASRFAILSSPARLPDVMARVCIDLLQR